MLHDLIYALTGHTGNIFKQLQSGQIKIVSGLPFISPQEETEINNILKLGTAYITIRKFINDHSLNFGTSNTRSSFKVGCYLEAFCDGLGDVLKTYHATLLKVESEIIEDAYLTHVHIQKSVELFHELFNKIVELLNTIKQRKCRGCQILSIVYRFSQTGHTMVRDAMLTILQRCMVVMYRQLSTWLLHGILFDTHEEFYIGQHSLDNNSTDESNKSDMKLSQMNAKTVTDSFFIRTEMLPSFIPPRAVNMILFIGSSLHLFGKSRDDVALNYKNNKSVPDVILNTSAQRKDGVLREHEENFMRQFLNLQNDKVFSTENFETCIDSIRFAVAEELWVLVIVKAQLVSQLMMLKDFYLLGLGELFLVFLSEGQKVLGKPITRTSEHDINQAFIRSALKVQIDEDGALKYFKIKIAKHDTGNKGVAYPMDASGELESLDPWSRLGMTFNVNWPLHIIFTPSILEKYNKLFKFLLRVKRTQYALQSVWALLMQAKDCIRDFNKADATRLIANWMLRMHMSHLVDSLQYYVQADVLESHFSNLLNKIKHPTSRDFEKIVSAHEQYLTALLAQCFILSTPVFRSLISVLDICQRFCQVVTTSITSTTRLSRAEIDKEMEKISSEFKKHSVLLFHTLSGVSNQQTNPHLAQFLLLLDYNKYYSLHT